VAAGDGGGWLSVWDVPKEALAVSFENREIEVYSVAAHPSNPSLVAQVARPHAKPNMLVQLFDIRSGKLYTFNSSIAFSNQSDLKESNGRQRVLNRMQTASPFLQMDRELPFAMMMEPHGSMICGERNLPSEPFLNPPRGKTTPRKVSMIAAST